MANYEVSNPFTNNLRLRSGPSVIFGIVGSLESGKLGKGDFIFTYRSQLIADGQTRASVDDRWIHVTELDGAPADGWLAVKHLGRSYAAITLVTTMDLMVSFGVELEGYNPTTLTGILTPK